jgi:8-oxo-dGTP pyrophosphatase MutT (NUDIX family)
MTSASPPLAPERFRAWAAERLALARTAREATRGDHDLNPGMAPASPLVPAAVLVPLVARAARVTALLTQRTDNLASHKGQISFPGGHAEPGDGSPEETALRETEEEIGLDRRHVEIIGRLDPYATRTGFLVTPVVGWVVPPFELTPDPREVAEVFEVPVAHFLEPGNFQRMTRVIAGTVSAFYAVPYESHYIWGVTAGMLKNFFDILCGPAADGR